MANTKKVKGAEALLLSLIAEGADIIFGYPGGQVIPVYDSLYDYSTRIRHILTRHEQGAVHAAQGFARATGKVGVCLATSGPGATNFITGIADAMLDSTPIVCITGQVPAAMLGSDAFQEADMVSMTTPITKWNFQVTSASEIPGAIAKAFYIARSGRPGPVVIDITKNAQIEEAEFSYEPCTYLRSYLPTPIIDHSAIDSAIDMINSAAKPLLIIGQGVKLSNAEQELILFAERGNLPIASTLMGISAVPNNHPLFIGNLGMHGNVAANRMTQDSDLIIAIGMRFSDRITGDVKSYAPNAKIIHIDIDLAELGKNLRVDLPIKADAKEAIQLLTEGIKHVERADWFTFASDMDAEEKREVTDNCGDPKGEYISMAQVVQQLAIAEESNAIIVTDVGQNQMFSALYSRFNHTRSFITSGGLGTMGYGLPAAIGAKVGVPEREVVAIMGDGGFQMNIQELGTIMQENLGLKMIVLNNSFLGMVRQWQELFFDARYSFTNLANPDFVAIAKAYNINAAQVSSPAELNKALEELVNAEGSYLLEIRVMAQENIFPMVPAGASLSKLIYK